jgi:hypothetical protein
MTCSVSAVIGAKPLDSGQCVGVSAPAPDCSTSSSLKVNPLEVVLRLIESHVEVTADERIAIALWTLHTHVFERFSFTPRLTLLSPVKGCGKTTLLTLLEALVAKPFHTDNVTPAAIYHWLDVRPHSTVLLDEGDNLGLSRNAVLRSVFNSGHRRGGNISRFVAGFAQQFPSFAPLALAAIGTLPSPLLDRSIMINMQRLTPGHILQPLDANDLSFRAVREAILSWAATCSLNRNPQMPPSLHNRTADNWRVLFSIADDLGCGEEARNAATELSANRRDEDPGVVLLTDIHAVFNERRTDRIGSGDLVEALLALDSEYWGECGGHNGDRSHPLTQGQLARLLRPFGIFPKTIWPMYRRATNKSSRGYLKSQFEHSWSAYCSGSATQQVAR